MIDEALEIGEEHLHESDWVLSVMRRWLAACYRGQGRKAEGRAILETACRDLDTALGESHWETRAARLDLDQWAH